MGKRKSNKNSGGNGLSLNKISFWLIVATAALYLTAAILSALSGVINAKVSMYITYVAMGIAEALTVCVVAILGWRHIRNKGVAWIILYVLVLIVIAVGIVLPRILL